MWSLGPDCRDFSFHRANYRSRDSRWDITCPLEESEQRQVSMTAASGRSETVARKLTEGLLQVA